jgi:hypothetical protein
LFLDRVLRKTFFILLNIKKKFRDPRNPGGLLGDDSWCMTFVFVRRNVEVFYTARVLGTE